MNIRLISASSPCRRQPRSRSARRRRPRRTRRSAGRSRRRTGCRRRCRRSAGQVGQRLGEQPSHGGLVEPGRRILISSRRTLSRQRKWSHPCRPVHGCRRPSPRSPSCTGADHPPAAAAAATPGGNVAASAWSSPPARIQGYGSTPSAAGRVAHLVRHLERVPCARRSPTPLAVAMWPEVGEQPVGDVDHRGGAEPGRRRAGRSTAPRAAGTPRRAASASGSRGTARCSRPRRTRCGRPARPRRRAGRRRATTGARPPQVAERGDRDRQRRAGRHVAADHARADQRRLRGQPVGQFLGPARRPGRAARTAPPAARSAPRPSRRCRRGWPRRPGARRRRRSTSPAGSAGPRRARRCDGHHPAVRRGHHRARRRRGRAGWSARRSSRAVIRAISPNSPASAMLTATVLSLIGVSPSRSVR